MIVTGVYRRSCNITTPAFETSSGQFSGSRVLQRGGDTRELPYGVMDVQLFCVSNTSVCLCVSNSYHI
jgi:hypothetical protein